MGMRLISVPRKHACHSMNILVMHLTGMYLMGVHLIGYPCHRCCAQQTGMYILIVEALLVAIYLPKDVYMYIRHPATWGLPS
jgi:disulfide bond formation protein DsbB